MLCGTRCSFSSFAPDTVNRRLRRILAGPRWSEETIQLLKPLTEAPCARIPDLRNCSPTSALPFNYKDDHRCNSCIRTGSKAQKLAAHLRAFGRRKVQEP